MKATPSIRCGSTLLLIALPRQPDCGRRTPDRHRQQEVDDVDDDDGRPHRTADGDTDAGRTAAGVVAEVAVHEDHQYGEHQHLPEGPQHIPRWQELVEVVVVRPRTLPVEGG